MAPLTALMSRPDLLVAAGGRRTGQRLRGAPWGEAHPDRGLVELTFDGGTLLAAERDARDGTTVRVRIPAREVILATREPEGLSLHNVLSGTVSAVHADPAFDHVIVQIAVGRVLLLAEVTRDAVGRLGIGGGRAPSTP